MKNIFSSIDWKKTGLFAAGVAFGTAGIKVLSSDDAKTATTIQENAEDIYAEAVQINEDRAAEADAKVEESLDEEVSADEEGAE